MRVTIASLGALGDGIASVEGKDVFVPYTVPGDVVDIAFRGQRGTIKKIITPGLQRHAPACEVFTQCGGCALQHLSDEYYRSWKHDLIVTALHREGIEGDGLVAPLVMCPPASRRRASFAITQTKTGVQFGFNRKRSSDIIGIDHCPILAPALSEKLPALRDFASLVSRRSFDLSVSLCDNGLDLDIVSVGDEFFTGAEIEKFGHAMSKMNAIRLSHNGELVIALEGPCIRFGDVALMPPPGGFLQASREGEAALINLVSTAAQGAKKIADLFCGAGTFSLPLGARAAVDAFDNDGPAIDAMNNAARRASLRFPVSAHRRNLFDQPMSAAELKPYDVIIFDPPRAGAQAQALEIAKGQAARVIGVSCNPVSFARDAALLRAGGYSLVQVTPVDQFVYGAHIELVGTFTRD